MGEENIKDGKIPLGLCKQAYMKLDSAMTDIHEIHEDPDLDEDDKIVCEQMTEVLGVMMAHITNIVSKELDEESFMNENIPMDEIDPFPGDEGDVLDMEII